MTDKVESEAPGFSSYLDGTPLAVTFSVRQGGGSGLCFICSDYEADHRLVSEDGKTLILAHGECLTRHARARCLKTAKPDLAKWMVFSCTACGGLTLIDDNVGPWGECACGSEHYPVAERLKSGTRVRSFEASPDLRDELVTASEANEVAANVIRELKADLAAAKEENSVLRARVRLVRSFQKREERAFWGRSVARLAGGLVDRTHPGIDKAAAKSVVAGANLLLDEWRMKWPAEEGTEGGKR